MHFILSTFCCLQRSSVIRRRQLNFLLSPTDPDVQRIKKKNDNNNDKIIIILISHIKISFFTICISSTMIFIFQITIKSIKNKTLKHLTFLNRGCFFYQLLVISYQLLFTSYQLLVTFYQLLVTSYQLPFTGYFLLVKVRVGLGLGLRWLRLGQGSVRFRVRVMGQGSNQ